jgi:cysteinyl-tRNA synthetase
MSLKYLGEQFDIHGGGIDLVFPHHENEIAQSCALLSRRQSMANYWIHNGHLNVNGVKMSKSLGNFFTVHELLERYNGEVLRMVFLMTHYAAPMDFNLATLDQAKNVLDRWYATVKNVLRNYEVLQSETFSCNFEIKQNQAFEINFLEALSNNMNTPKAISILSEVIDEINKFNNFELATIFINICRQFLGIMKNNPYDWFCNVTATKKEWIESKIKERTVARKSKDYTKADSIRDELLQNGIAIEDIKDRTIWKTNL